MILPFKPHWERLHDWQLEDFEFEYQQLWELCQLLRKHPTDGMGAKLMELVKMVKERIKSMIVSYEQIYGDKPRLAEIKLKIEDKLEYKRYRNRMLSMVIDDYAAMEEDYLRLKTREES